MEMLVVLVIIGVGVATTVMALRPDPRGVVRQEADRLAALLGLASEQSAVGGLPLAWIGHEGGYEFQVRELTDLGPDWAVVRGDDLLRPRQLPSGTAIRSIRVDGRMVGLGQRVPLHGQGAHDVSVEIGLGDARARVTGTAGHFRSALAAEGGA
jgi:general secretion pathway protein H